VPARPGSDVAIMLGLAHEILRNGWQDQSFLDTYTSGFAPFAAYLTGDIDGVAKTPHWAAEIAQVSAQDIVALAKRMAENRTMITVSWSLTRQEHGEQPFWMATTLAAMLGQIGLPGGGVAYGYGASNSVGNERRKLRYAALPQFKNPVKSFIPVARISDMLLKPGAEFRFNGETHTYPDIRLVYWAGGNPFHHQDLTRLCTAWPRPETVIVHDSCWNALAKRADIVLPCTTPLERDDLMITPRDRFIIAMKAAIPPVGEARNDHDILRGIGRKLGVDAQFSEGRSTKDWLEHIYQKSRELAQDDGIELPAYETFMKTGVFETELPDAPWDAFTAFRKAPDQARLKTPSGKIEITSQKIESFASTQMLPYPAWYEPQEWLGAATDALPFHLISGQPADKLHAQLDHGRISRMAKLNGRASLGIHPADASRLGISNYDCVRVYNARGACLATAVLDPGLLRGVVRMSTGAWLDAIEQADGTLLCRHGNPNLVTRDAGTSELAQGPVAHSCLVALAPYEADQTIEVFVPPIINT